MKNVTILTKPEDIHAFARKLFRTPEFQKSYDEGGLVFEVVDMLASMPCYFFERSDDRLETAHFTAWWGGIQMRPNDYESDAVHDDYLYHEMTHAATMGYVEDPSRFLYDSMVSKNLENEAVASVMSEVAIYFENPTLRAKTFPFEVMVDRYLKDPAYHDMWKNRRPQFIQSMIADRRNMMHEDYKPDENDLPAKWIHRFGDQNREACLVWKDTYQEIEEARRRLLEGCATIGPDAAMKAFMDWLTSPAIMKGTDIPFPDQAKAFADVYWANKAEYKKDIEATDTPPARLPPPQTPPAPA